MDGNGPRVEEEDGTGMAADQPLLDLLDALVNDRGRTAAAEALGVNYRTAPKCQQSRRISPRMRQVLQEFRDSQGVGDDEPLVVVGDGAGEDSGETPEERAAALEQENRELRETVEAQAEELEALRRGVPSRESGNGRRAGTMRLAAARDCRWNCVRHDGPTGCPMPEWSPWRSSPTRSTPSVRRRRWSSSGTGWGLAAIKWPAVSNGHRPRWGGGNWSRDARGVSPDPPAGDPSSGRRAKGG